MDCYTIESKRKGQKYIAQEWEDQGGPAEHGFTYDGFTEKR